MGYWNKINFSDGYYVSKSGLILSVKRIKHRFLKTKINPDGYLYVSLRKPKKQWKAKVHRLVAMAFLPNKENKPCVNHIDGNKLNNSVGNLEWCTYKENMDHASRVGLLNNKGEDNAISKLTKEDVLNIRKEYNGFRKIPTLKTLGKKYGVSRSVVGRIVNKKIWRHI